MKSLQQIAKENGFQYRKVSTEEREDGVGVIAGDNWIKDQKPYPVWYTTDEMIAELGLPEPQYKTVDLDKSVGLDAAKQMALDWLKGQNAKWYDIYRHKYTFGGSAITVSVRYGV